MTHPVTRMRLVGRPDPKEPNRSLSDATSLDDLLTAILGTEAGQSQEPAGSTPSLARAADPPRQPSEPSAPPTPAASLMSLDSIVQEPVRPIAAAPAPPLGASRPDPDPGRRTWPWPALAVGVSAIVLGAVALGPWWRSSVPAPAGNVPSTSAGVEPTASPVGQPDLPPSPVPATDARAQALVPPTTVADPDVVGAPPVAAAPTPAQPPSRSDAVASSATRARGEDAVAPAASRELPPSPVPAPPVSTVPVSTPTVPPAALAPAASEPAPAPASTVAPDEPAGSSPNPQATPSAAVADTAPPPDTTDAGAAAGAGQPTESAPRDADTRDPVLISSVRPIYPEYARRIDAVGDVEVEVTIDETGRVTRAAAVSGPSYLRGAAVTAVLQWRYQPALADGKPVATRRRIRLSFR